MNAKKNVVPQQDFGVKKLVGTDFLLFNICLATTILRPIFFYIFFVKPNLLALKKCFEKKKKVQP